MAVALVAIGVSAAASAYAAKKQRDAAREAAGTQAAAGQQALDAQRSGYQQQRADFEPYASAGRDAMDRLRATAGTYTGGQGRPGEGMPAQRMGQGTVPMNPQTGLGQLGLAGQQPMPQGLGPSGGPIGGAGFQPSGGPMGAQMAPQGAPGALGAPPPAPGMSGPNMGQAGYAVQQAPGGGPMPGASRRVRAPTGEVAMLPLDAAQRAVSKGATYLD